MNINPSSTGRQYGPLGIFGDVAAGTARSAFRAFVGGEAPPAAAIPPAKSAVRLRYEHDDAQVTQLAWECRRCLSLTGACGLLATVSASALMQGVPLLWFFAVPALWVACEGAWHLLCTWYDKHCGYHAAVARRNLSMDALVEEERVERELGAQQRYQRAVDAVAAVPRGARTTPAFALQRAQGASVSIR